MANKLVWLNLLSIFCSNYTTYALYSPNYGKIYIGYSSNVPARMLSHNKLAKKGWTVEYRPWKLVHNEVFETKAEAMKRERQLKSAQGRKFIWSLIAEDRSER